MNCKILKANTIEDLEEIINDHLETYIVTGYSSHKDPWQASEYSVIMVERSKKDEH